MALYYANTTSINSHITLKIRVNNKALVRSIELVKCQNIKLPFWQYLDLLSEIMPKYIHAHLEDFEVALCKDSTNPICANHTCIAVTHLCNGGKKLYCLEDSINCYSFFKTHPAHLRAIIYWWRSNRNQYENTPKKWYVLKVSE